MATKTFIQLVAFFEKKEYDDEQDRAHEFIIYGWQKRSQ